MRNVSNESRWTIALSVECFYDGLGRKPEQTGVAAQIASNESGGWKIVEILIFQHVERAPVEMESSGNLFQRQPSLCASRAQLVPRAVINREPLFWDVFGRGVHCRSETRSRCASFESGYLRRSNIE